MPRPHCCRRVAGRPGAAVFKPAGIPASELEWLVLSLDEFEALRLADLEGLHHEEAAARMKISRATFGRIVENARRKVASALCRGMALEIAGGSVSFSPADPGRCGRGGRRGAGPVGACVCPKCGRRTQHERGVPCSGQKCPACGTAMVRE